MTNTEKDKVELPSLPQPSPTHYRERGMLLERMEMYTADQMREYALAALSTVPEAAQPVREQFEKWAKAAGYDVAYTYDTERSRHVWLNPMTADLWTAWQAALSTVPEVAQPVALTDEQILNAARFWFDADWVGWTNVIGFAREIAEKSSAAPIAQPVVWRMVTPDQGNVIFLTDPAEAKRFKEMDGREVRPLGYIDAAPIAQPVETSKQAEEDQFVINRLASILAEIAIALKGEELPLHRHGYHDLAELTRIKVLECNLLLHQVEELKAAAQPVEQEPYAWIIEGIGPEMYTKDKKKARALINIGHSVKEVYAAPVSAEAIRREDVINALKALYRPDPDVIEMREEIDRRDRFNGAITRCIDAVRALASQPAQESGK